MTSAELRELRKRLGLTQAEMGERLGLTADAVYSLECGRNKIRKGIEGLAVKLKKAVE